MSPKETSMFPGNNELQLNQSCMIEAVQMYLNSKFKEGAAPIVTVVKEKSSDKCFIIITKAEDKTASE